MLNIIPIRALKDNYVWTLHNGQHAVIIDPSEAAPVRAYLDAQKIKLAGILCTHHHGDHVGGVCELAQVYNAPVYGSPHEDIPCLSRPVGEGDVIDVPELGIKLDVLEIPGHTRRHLAYVGCGSVFCGDTLFGCGCGGIFEGTVEQLFGSLQRLASLPGETKVYSAHECTEDNIRFALACEPGNAQLTQRQKDSGALRAAGRPTLPSTIALERAVNPFLRCTTPEVIGTVERQSGLKFPPGNEMAVFAALREWKDNFA